MSLPKELIEAVKQDKKMLAKKFTELKKQLSISLNEFKKAVTEKENNGNQDVVEAIKDLGNKIGGESTQETAFSSIIEQGKLAVEQVKIDAAAKNLQEQLIKTSGSTSEEQKNYIREQIKLLKSDKLDTLEAKQEAREVAEKTVEALDRIDEAQTDLIKEFKEGFKELRGTGLGGLIKMLVVGIPALLGGIVVGIGSQIAAVLSRFESIALIFRKIGVFFAPILKVLSGGAGAIGGFLKTLPMLGTFFKNLFAYAGRMFTLGSGLAKLAGPIGIAITIITGLIGGIKGAIKGFKEDGIIGMVREGIIGIFNSLIGGLVKMVGSMIGGIFKLLGFEKIGEAIKGGFSDFVDGIIGGFRGIFNMIGGLFTLDFDLLKEGFGQVLDGIINTVMGIIKGIGGIIVGIIVGAIKVIIDALKAVFIKLPIALVKFQFKMWKAIFFDLPVAAFKMVFDGIKFLFIGLPVMLIDKVNTFFTSMVESIGNAFSSAFDFVKRIGKASRAALKAAVPGGESPKEAFMRVMGGDKAGEEKEEKENLKKLDEKRVETTEQFTPQIKPKEKETIEEFEARMMASTYGTTPSMAMTASPEITASSMAVDSESAPSGEGSTLTDKLNGIKEMMLGIITAPFTLLKTIHSTILGVVQSVIKGVMGLVGTILKFIGKLGKAGIAAVKAIMPGGDSPAEAFMKVLTDEGAPKKGKIDEAEGMTPVLSSETPEEKLMTDGAVAFNARADERNANKESLESALAYGETTAGLLDPQGAAARVANAGPSTLSPAASIAAGPEEAKAPQKLSFTDIVKKISSFGKKAASLTPVGMLSNSALKIKNSLADKEDSPLESLIDNLPPKAKEFVQNIKTKLSPIAKTEGAQLTMAQRENAELKGESSKVSSAPIIAPSNINNSKSSVSNVTVAAPPHIDKTQTLFGTTQLAY